LTSLTGVKAPVWLNEGLAIYKAREWTFFLISILTKASLTDRLIPLPVFILSFPAEEEPAELAYAESFMFISFLINKAYNDLAEEYTLVREMLSARSKSGLTQEAVAELMGTTKSAVSRLESAGKHAPSLTTLKKYAQAVGCDLKIEFTQKSDSVKHETGGAKQRKG